jgi:hypothetical protein
VKFVFDRHGVHRVPEDPQADAAHHIQHDLDRVAAHAQQKSVDEVAAELHLRLEHHGWQFDDAMLQRWARQMVAGDRIVVEADSGPAAEPAAG